MKRYIVFLVLNFLWFNVSAQEISFEEARQKAKEFFFATDKTPQSLKSASGVEVDTFATYYTTYDNQLKSAGQKEEPAFYIFNRTDKPGFVIVSADKRIREVIAYSNTGVFYDPNPGLKTLLNQYVEEISYAKENNINANTITYDFYVPYNGDWLLKSIEWDQIPAPYNSKCPNNLPVGCQATAMAQIIYFYKYPRIGNGTSTYQWNEEGDEISVNFGEAEYKYELMKDKPITGVQNDDIALLSYHCGVAIEMKYKQGGSTAGANTTKIKEAFEDHFKYKKCTVKASNDMFNILFNWEKAIKKEIDNKRPVFLGLFK
jgi:hypothetical protein